MIVEIEVPAAGESVTEATVSAILAEPGSVVREDDALIELETDKANMPVNASHAGKVEILVEEGEDVKVGQIVAKIDTDAAGDAPAPPKQEEVKKEAPAPEPAPVEEAAPAEVEAPSAAPPAEDQASVNTDPTPAADSLMQQHQIMPGAVSGSGPGGRVLKEDVLAYIKNPVPAPTLLPPMPDMGFAPSAPKPIEGDRETRKKMTRLRRTIAERLVRAKQETAMLTTFNEVDMAPVMKMRNMYKDKFVEAYGVKLGFMSFFVKAAVEAMRSMPDINAYIDKDDIVYRNYYDISIAVGTERGLVVPVLRDADQLSFSEIEQKIGEFAKKAREGSLSLNELEGGGFTITNGGVYGSLLSTPILNPPQSAILGMHKIEKRAVVVGDDIVVRPMMYLAMSYDHRIVDGKEAVTFLVKMKETLEDPARILLGI